GTSLRGLPDINAKLRQQIFLGLLIPDAVRFLNQPDIPGGKKLIYNGVTMPLTAIADFAEKGKTDPLF
ncbi:hypothetical protein ACSLNV_28695, partial [Escherichia coli]|uniref:hypothetical protein n=1 Tax=Escherichia coli TaxID=562 RepID=UPI003EDF2D65